LPSYLRKTKAIEELIPWQYLNGIATGDLGEALQSLVGERAAGLSPNVVCRLKEQWCGEYDQWSKRDLSDTRNATSIEWCYARKAVNYPARHLELH
jgi:hypothetical protein